MKKKLANLLFNSVWLWHMNLYWIRTIDWYFYVNWHLFDDLWNDWKKCNKNLYLQFKQIRDKLSILHKVVEHVLGIFGIPLQYMELFSQRRIYNNKNLIWIFLFLSYFLTKMFTSHLKFNKKCENESYGCGIGTFTS